MDSRYDKPALNINTKTSREILKAVGVTFLCTNFLFHMIKIDKLQLVCQKWILFQEEITI